MQRLAAAALSVLSLVVLASCGSGAVSGPPPVPTPGTISISPTSATLFSDLATNFIITGGSGTYIITSSNQAVIPISGAFTGNVLAVVPNAVASDTNVTLTVSDTAGSPPVTAALVVKPRTVNNTVTVTPSASQSAACGTAVCSGGDAEVAVVLSQAGIPLANRQVRFDVISGDIGIITSPAGLPESTSLTATTTTDNTGTARVRIRVTPNATAQTALLQVTDVSSGFTQRTAITIAPSSNAPLNAQPGTITFKGTAANTCASGIQADVIVFGGRPPYQISQPGTFTVSPSVVTLSGGRFTVGATGQCTAGSAIAVVDNNGATVTVNAINTLSDVTPPTVPAFSVAPTDVTLNTCTDVASISLVGGTGSYFANSGNSAVSATANGSTGSIRRSSPSAALTGPVRVAFSDGQANREVTVNLSGLAAGPCP
ncbi:MAG: hypothetical protein ACXWAU_18065, partial [Usitatibacter sp.]